MKRILVIGDVITDVYKYCYFKKMCPDAPKAKAVVCMNEVREPGGAANVALNLLSLSQDCLIDLVGVIGADLARDIKFRSGNRIDMSHSYVVDPAFSLRKERIILDDETQIRVDQYESIREQQLAELQLLLEDYLKSRRPNFVIISDYAGGVWRACAEQLRPYLPVSFIDTKETDLSQFEGSLAIKLNKPELDKVCETEPIPERFCEYLVATLGKHGAVTLIRRPYREQGNTTVTHTLSVLGHKVLAVDVCGCGDTFLAGLVASFVKNGDMFTAMQFANAAAAVVVQEPRTAVAKLDRVLELIELMGRDHEAST